MVIADKLNLKTFQIVPTNTHFTQPPFAFVWLAGFQPPSLQEYPVKSKVQAESQLLFLLRSMFMSLESRKKKIAD